MTGEELERELPKAILGWYSFRKNTSKFIIDKNNIDCIESISGDWDYIVVTDAIETRDNPCTVLKILRTHLKPNGKLFLMMNNRLGIRYFCGDRDKYSGTVSDCLEDYKNIAASKMNGRMYDKTQIKRIIENSGIKYYHFFSVYPNFENPARIFSENYIPNEDVTNRIYPSYNFPESVYIEEKTMYQQLIDNGMFHQMANAFLIECPADGKFCEVLHVTSSLDRGRDDALYTIIYKDMVEKRAAYPEGKKKLVDIAVNMNELAANNISVVKGVLSDDTYRLPFVNGKTSQIYLEELLRKDVDEFVKEMDHFRDVILRSSDIVSEDKGDGEGAILKHGFVDLVPLNSFHINDDYVFFDQEFCVDNFPANALLWRMLTTYYTADVRADKIYPKDKLVERYNLKKCLDKWRGIDNEFLTSLRQERILKDYHRRVRTSIGNILNNRRCMNESAGHYVFRHYDIFAGIEGRKLILFGSGKFAEKFKEQYGRDFPIYAMLDNDQSKAGTRVDGVRVETPDYLKTLVAGSFKVVICIRAYEEVCRQLESMGIYDYSIYNPGRYYQTRPRATIEIINDTDERITDKQHNIGYVAGGFDMFHIGHLNLIRRAKEKCNYLIVGVMSDERMYNIKQKYPIIPCNERMQIVAGCRYVDRVEELPADRAGIRDAYHMFHFDCMFSGDDHKDSKDWLAARDYLRQQGADIEFLPYTKEQSSTEIRKKL